EDGAPGVVVDDQVHRELVGLQEPQASLPVRALEGQPAPVVGQVLTSRALEERSNILRTGSWPAREIRRFQKNNYPIECLPGSGGHSRGTHGTGQGVPPRYC